jgi:predicted amidohydrolase
MLSRSYSRWRIDAHYSNGDDAMTKRLLRVAGLQMSAVEWETEINARKIEAMAEEAAARGADLAMTPEMALSGFPQRGDHQRLAEPVPGPSSERFGALAKRLGIYLLVGMPERVEDRVYNSAIFISPSGEIVGKHRKVHINRYETHLGITNGDRFDVWEIERNGFRCKVGCMICYDREVPESARLLMVHGAEIILNPLCCGCPADETHRWLLRIRAYENEMFLAMTNHAAPRENGLSMMIGPDASLVHAAGEGEEVFVTEFDLDWLTEHRAKGIYGHHHRRPELYGDLLLPRPEGIPG